MPKSGSGYTFAATKAATTVVGTVAWYQPVVGKPGFAISSPSTDLELPPASVAED